MVKKIHRDVNMQKKKNMPQKDKPQVCVEKMKYQLASNSISVKKVKISFLFIQTGLFGPDLYYYLRYIFLCVQKYSERLSNG